MASVSSKTLHLDYLKKSTTKDVLREGYAPHKKRHLHTNSLILASRVSPMLLLHVQSTFTNVWARDMNHLVKVPATVPLSGLLTDWSASL